MVIILTPLVAFGLYLLLVSLLAGTGRIMAATSEATESKSDPYTSGEAPPTHPALLGYRPFFVVALFFAMLHLGVLVLARSNHSITAVLYLIGLALSLALFLIG